MTRDHPALTTRIFLACMALACVTYAFVWWSLTQPVLIERRGFLMGTAVEIKAAAGRESSQQAAAAIDRAFDEMARIETALSIYNAGSEVSRLNKTASTGPVKVSDELYFLIDRAIAWHTATDGVFDITVLPLKKLWFDAARKDAAPDEAALQGARMSVDTSAIRLDPAARTVFFEKAGMSIDLGGIAKGYAADRAAAVLRSHGIASAIINAGGDLYCLGGRPRGRPWIVGIQHPRDRSRLAYELKVRDRGVDTSGDYERYSVIGGKRYSHIIDPRSGIPIADTIVGATVIARDSLTADALATALCILGEPGLRIAEAAGADALILKKSADGNIRALATQNMMERYAGTKVRL